MMDTNFERGKQVEKQEEELKVQQLKSNEHQRLGTFRERMKHDDRDNQLDHDAAESMRRIKSLKLHKDGLIRAIEDRSEEIEKKV
jgi:hypothetical protein